METTFLITDSRFGSIETGFYQNRIIENCSVSVDALTYKDAVNTLHQYIESAVSELSKGEKGSFRVFEYNGELDKYGELVSKVVYELTFTKAIKYFK